MSDATDVDNSPVVSRAATPLARLPTPWLLLTIALAVRIVAAAPFAFTMPAYDEAYYASVAKSIQLGFGHSDGLGYDHTPGALRPPLFPYLLAGVYTLFGRDVLPSRLFQIPFSVLTVWLVYSLAARRFGPRAGFLSGLATAISPALAHYAHFMWTESLASTLLVLFFWLLDRYDRLERVVDAGLAGLALGVLALTKSMWAYFSLVVALWLWWRAGWDLRRSAAPAVLIVLGVALVVLPWTARNYRILDKFVLVSDMQWWPIAMGNYYPTDDWYLGNPTREQRAALMESAGRFPMEHRERYYRWVALQVISDHQPWWIFQKIVRTTVALYSVRSQQLRFVERGWVDLSPTGARFLLVTDLVGHYLLLSAGLVALWVVPGGRSKWLVLVAILFLNGVHTLANSFPRYLVTVLPLFYLYIGPLLSGGFDRRAVAHWQWAGAGLTVAAFVVVPLPKSVELVSQFWSAVR